MESSVPTAAAEQRPTAAPDVVAEERLDRNLTPAIAEAGESAAYLRYAIAAVATLAVVLLGVFAFNAIVDPFSLVGTKLLPPALENDRSIKLDLIDKLKQNPQIVVLGSSRSRQAEPAFIQKLTGKTGFNAGVTGGSAADSWVMVREIASRFPSAKRTYIWFVNVGIATAGVNPQLSEDRRSSRFLGHAGVRFSLADVGKYLGFQATKASYRVVKACIEGRFHGRLRYNADGSLTAASLRFLPEHAASLARSVAQAFSDVRSKPLRVGPFDPRRLYWFKKALAYMNAHGATPVIVLNPIFPKIYRYLESHGYPRKKQSLRVLRRLQKHYRFVLVDCQDIRKWGGKAADFSNATHVNRQNMRRMLRYIVAHSDGAFR